MSVAQLVRVGKWVARSGRFHATRRQVKHFLMKGHGCEWNLALNDGCGDPNYGTAVTHITKFERTSPTKDQPRRRFVVEGVISFEEGALAFTGYAEPSRCGRAKTLQHSFELFQPA